MKRIHTSASSRSSAGFSLTEILFALALIAGSVLPVLGVLSMGLSDAKQAGDHRLTANLRNTVQQLLSDPAWPVEAKPEGEWTAERFVDAIGHLLPVDEAAKGEILVRMKSLPPHAFQSSLLEVVQVTFHAPDRPDFTLARTQVQRRKKAGT